MAPSPRAWLDRRGRGWVLAGVLVVAGLRMRPLLFAGVVVGCWMLAGVLVGELGRGPEE